MHKHTKGIDHARFVSFELGHQIVQLTPKSLEVIKQIRATGARLRRELLAGVPPKDIERCAAVLAHIKGAVERVLP